MSALKKRAILKNWEGPGDEAMSALYSLCI